jgi:hypothetical protein
VVVREENDLRAVSASGRRAAAIQGRCWREVHQFMLASFDASGHESDQPFMVVAGFVSSAGDWDDFSQKWLKRLGEDGLPYFHASRFRSSTGIFDGWDTQEDRRRALARDLMDLVVSHSYRYFITAVKPLEFKQAFTEDERRTFNINSYALCGRYCVAELGRWVRGDDLVFSTERAPDLVFEDGDIGKGKLRDLLVKHHYPEPQFLPGKVPLPTKVGIVPPFVPLQAADWLAYKSFQLLKDGDSALENQDKWRWPMRQFRKNMIGIANLFTPPTLDQIKDDLDALNEDTSGRVILVQPMSDGRFF